MSKDTTIGVSIAILGTIFLAVMGMFVKLIDHGASGALVLFVRFFLSLIIVSPFAFFEYRKGLTIENWWLLLIRSIFGLIAMACYFYAISHLPLADASLLVSTAPAFVPLILLIFFKIKTRAIVYVGILISLIGVAVIMRPGSGLFHWPALIGSFSGLGAAIATVCLKRLMSNGKNGPSSTLFFYFLINSVIALGFSFYDWKTPSLHTCFYMLGVGVFGAGFQICLTYATKFAQIRIISTTMLMSVIFGGIIDWIIWNTVPGIPTILGSIFVLIGICVVVAKNQ